VTQGGLVYIDIQFGMSQVNTNIIWVEKMKISGQGRRGEPYLFKFNFFNGQKFRLLDVYAGGEGGNQQPQKAKNPENLKGEKNP